MFQFFFQPQNRPPLIGGLLWPRSPQKALIRSSCFLVFQLRKCWSIIGYYSNPVIFFSLTSTSKHHCETWKTFSNVGKTFLYFANLETCRDLTIQTKQLSPLSVILQWHIQSNFSHFLPTMNYKTQSPNFINFLSRVLHNTEK